MRSLQEIEVALARRFGNKHLDQMYDFEPAPRREPGAFQQKCNSDYPSRFLQPCASFLLTGWFFGINYVSLLQEAGNVPNITIFIIVGYINHPTELTSTNRSFKLSTQGSGKDRANMKRGDVDET